jgi:hypothetical protein
MPKDCDVYKIAASSVETVTVPTDQNCQTFPLKFKGPCRALVINN